MVGTCDLALSYPRPSVGLDHVGTMLGRFGKSLEHDLLSAWMWIRVSIQYPT